MIKDVDSAAVERLTKPEKKTTEYEVNELVKVRCGTLEIDGPGIGMGTTIKIDGVALKKVSKITMVIVPDDVTRTSVEQLIY